VVVDYLFADQAGSVQLLESGRGRRFRGHATCYADGSLDFLQLLKSFLQPGLTVVESDPVAWFPGVRRQPERSI